MGCFIIYVRMIGKKKYCKQWDHVVDQLLDYNNIFYCKKCKNIMFPNGRQLLPQPYWKYVEFAAKRGQKIYTEKEILNFINSHS